LHDALLLLAMEISMDIQQRSFFAGIISTMLFASSTIPMLVKAFRTRDVRSYTLPHLAMSNVGNAVHGAYV
jgi:hypothetical protein